MFWEPVDQSFIHFLRKILMPQHFPFNYIKSSKYIKYLFFCVQYTNGSLSVIINRAVSWKDSTYPTKTLNGLPKMKFPSKCGGIYVYSNSSLSR